MIDFKTLKTQVEDDMARTDADFRYRRWCESNDIAWEDFTSLDHLKETEHRNVQKPYIREACGE